LAIDLLLQLDASARESLQTQIVAQLSLAIARGNVPLNEPLPSSRHLAAQLGVGRNTVMLAYQRLLDDELIITHPRRGYFVNPNLERTRIQTRSEALPDGAKGINWSEKFSQRASNWHSVSKPKDWQQAPYPFIYGQIGADLFPLQYWRECARDAVSVRAIKTWSVDRVDHDDPLLLEQIRTRLLPKRGILASNESILITVGAQHALYMIGELLWRHQGAIVGLEDPGYADVRQLAEFMGAQTKPLAVDDYGLLVDDQLGACTSVYVTPSHQSPTTVTLPHDRRQSLLKRAERDDFLIIEDDYESEFNFQTRPEPALKSMDPSGRVIYIGSLSKTVSPGLRMGYIVADTAVIEELRALRRLMLRHPAANNQLSMALFLSRGYHDALLSKLFKIYQRRRGILIQALRTHLPDFEIQPSLGGSAVWVKAPEWLDTRELAQTAYQEGIIIEPGEHHFAAEAKPKHFMRLGFSAIGEGSIETGIALLAQVYRNIRQLA